MSDAPNYDGSTDELVKLGYFAAMAKDIAAAKTIRQTLDQIMRHVGEIFAPANWSILLRDRETGDLRFTLITGSAVDSLRSTVVPKGKGIAGWIAENGMPLIVEDVSRDSRFDDSYDKIAEFETRSIIGVPLKTETEVFGVIELVNTLEERPFTPLDLKFLTTIAEFGAIAIEKAYYLSALHRISSRDSLTGLLNRRSFERLYRRERDRLERTGRNFSVLLIDMDEFKAINDRWGHTEGDRALRTVAAILKKHTRKIDILARFGGDEFVVLLPETSQQQSQQIVKRIRNAIAYASREVAYTLSVSIGVREAAGDEADPLGLADQLMYEEKRRKQERTIDSVADNLGEFFEEEGEERPEEPAP